MVMEIVKDDRNREMLQDKNEITQDNLILEDVIDEDVSIKYTTFYLSVFDKLIKVLRTQRFSNEIGEIDEEWDFETNLSLTDEDEETIKLFCEEQGNQ
jgi:hypothetical protein